MEEFFAQLFHIVTFGGIAQGVFVVLVLNNKSVRKSRANLFLSILLIALSFSIAHILFAGTVLNHFSGNVYHLGDPTFFLIAPLLWFYTNELTGQPVKWSWRLILHFLPFLIIIFLSLTLNQTDPGFFLKVFFDQHYRFINIGFWIAMVAQFSAYQAVTRKKLAGYQAIIQMEVSNKENVDITWIRFFMILFLLINVFFLIALFAAIHLVSANWITKATALTFSLSVFALGYKGILQKQLFDRTQVKASDSVNLPSVEPKESKSDPGLMHKVLEYMNEKKPYLDPELTLSSLAKDLTISRSQLSQLINDGAGQNFYDFINKYRVEEVKKLMVDPKMANFNLLGIALEAGFKSKSTFNLIFKRFTGITPTEYRKNLLS